MVLAGTQDCALVMLNADVLGGAVQDAWGACAPATWNRHVATALARARAVPLAA